ncbi:uncharacterized protein LOC122087584 [Macadamia integrifolia]|uniref:uncharacterized protein LOC122087584 n=1 Tax=Macadamia integrifolia TaxID=60698 RepID=UPI001C4F1EB6|nr:uncharacterized protein LOC122087584 [Macadamia integrifolia]
MIIERVVTVEYLETTMTEALLRKFPDNSAFDFDYTQSGIWSPLVPRGQCLVSGSSIEIRRKLSDGFEKIAHEKIKKVSSKIKKKMVSAKKKVGSDFSTNTLKGSTPRKGWAKVLRAASKRFKKQKDSSTEIKLSNYLRNGSHSVL